MDLENLLIPNDEIDEGDDISIDVMEDLSTIKDPRVLENEKREARRRSYMRNRSKYAANRHRKHAEEETDG